MHKRAEIKGSARTLTKNIELMRAVMGTRGPWKRSIGLRAYHDELLFRLAKTRYQARFHQKHVVLPDMTAGSRRCTAPRLHLTRL